MKVKEMTYCSVFTVLIAIGALIKIPVPICPFTLQFFFTTMAGVVLGKRLGAASVLLYTLLCLAGLPIFAEGGGIWYFLKPTFGYLLGFIVGAYVTGSLVEGLKFSKKWTLFIASFAGLLCVYAIGMLYYYILGNYVVNAPIGMGALFLYCFLLAVPGDVALCILVVFTGGRIRNALKEAMVANKEK